MNSQNNYKAAGVDIDAADKLIKNIKPLINKTISGNNSLSNFGGFGGLFDLSQSGFKNPVLVSGTDGVGTKLKIAQDLGLHDTIGIDLVAMCVNDIVVQGAKPLFFLDYFACGKLDNNVAENVIKGISDGCVEAGCELLGGETAEMPGMYPDGEYDLAGFTVGAVEKEDLLPRKDIAENDKVIGIESSGIHSNGYSLVRKVVSDNQLKLNESPEGFEKTLGEELLKPTKIYVKACLDLIKRADIKAFAHITGGGITENLPRVMPKGLSAEIDFSAWEMPYIFKWLQKTGQIEFKEMLRTFNCGIGMIAITPADEVEKTINILSENNLKAFEIGKIIKGNKVKYKL